MASHLSDRQLPIRLIQICHKLVEILQKACFGADNKDRAFSRLDRTDDLATAGDRSVIGGACGNEQE